MRRTPDLGQETEVEMVLPLLNVFWLSKDNRTGLSEREILKKRMEVSIKECYGRTFLIQLG